MTSKNRKIIPVVIAYAVLLANSAARTHAQFEFQGASGATYYGEYHTLTPAQREDFNQAQWALRPRYDEMERRRLAERNPEPVPRSNVRTVVQQKTKEPTVQELAGRASSKFEQTETEFRAAIEEIRKNISEAIARHEEAPLVRHHDETRRIALFKTMLERTVTMGQLVLTKTESLRGGFESWRRAAQEASPIFRKAEAHFRSKAEAETIDTAKAMYVRAADWYAARAIRAELRARSDIPPTFEGAMLKIKRNSAACEDILSFLNHDPYLGTAESESQKDLADFNEAFKSIGQVMDEWTKQLIKDLQPPQEKSKSA